MESLRKPVKMLKEERQRLAPRHAVAIIFVFVFVFVFRSTNAVVARPQQTVATANANDVPEELEPSQVSLKKSRVYVFVDKTGFGHQHGIEGRLKSGQVTLGAVESAGEFVFDMTSFDGDSDAARRSVGLEGSTDLSTRRQVNDNMKGATILNVAQYPTATFAIKSATLLDKKSRTGAALYEFAGGFTLRGKQRPLKFEAEVETKDQLLHIRGRFNVLQTEYGITPFRKAFGTIGVADQLTIHGDLWVAPEKSEPTP